MEFASRETSDFPPRAFFRHTDRALAATSAGRIAAGPGVMAFPDPPVATLVARDVNEVRPLLDELATWQSRGGWAAGFLAYEAFVPGPTLAPRAMFHLFVAPCALPLPPPLGPANVPTWRPVWTEADYLARFHELKGALGRGDIYQANLTFPLLSHDATPDRLRRLFLSRGLSGVAAPEYAAWLAFDEGLVCGLSPELFLAREGDALFMRPMKGTLAADLDPRGLTEDPKSQAENLMIVDMCRNDLGRVARAGSVHVPSLFHIDRVGGLWQMSSTVAAESGAGLRERLEATFPCASVTGAPKRMAMELLRGWEIGPRGGYCGAVGWLGPTSERWSVGIRTVWAPREGPAVYGIGSGVVWDSDGASEWAECLAKAAHLSETPFSWLETMSDDPATWEAHLDRVERSAARSGYPFSRETALAALIEATSARQENRRVRLLVDQHGVPTVELHPLDPWPSPVTARVLPAGSAHSRDGWLRVKTTRREVYDAAFAAREGAQEALLVNEDGQATEFTRGNLLVRRGSRWVTPHPDFGLLQGVGVTRLVDAGKAEWGVVTREEALMAECRWVNDLRGALPAELRESWPVPSR